MKLLTFTYPIHLTKRNFRTYFTLCLSGLFILLTDFAYGHKTLGQQAEPFVITEYTLSASAYELFSLDEAPVELAKPAPDVYDIYTLNRDVLLDLQNEQPKSWTINLPTQHGTSFQLKLEQADLFTPDFKVTAGRERQAVELQQGLHYQGTVNGHPNSLVAISVFPDNVMGLIMTDEGNYNLGQIKDGPQKGQFICYLDNNYPESLAGLSCSQVDDGYVYTPDEIRSDNEENDRALSDCVTFYFEVDYNIFQAAGSVQQTNNYVTGIYNQVDIVYGNESINTSLQEIYVWTSPSGYSGTSDQMLNQFQNVSASYFTADLAQLFSFTAQGSGIAAGFSGICNSNRRNSMCFSGIFSSYNNYPVYSATVYLATHEFGHLFGSRHTHACVWNGNGTAIDGCAGFTEGTCSLPSVPSTGTIMSYCAPNIPLNNGFGNQPGNVIRNRVSNGACLNPCGGGSSCAVTFNNTGCQNASLYWNNNGSLVYFGTVPAGGSYSYNPTYSGHIWVMKVGNTTVGNYTVNCNSPNYSFDAGGCNSSCAVTFNNTGCQNASLYWNNNGSLVYYSTVPASGSYSIGTTYSGHIWVMKVGNTTVGNYTVNCNSPNYSFNAGGCSNICTGSAYRYRIINVRSGLALDVEGASTNWGANVLQWGNNGGNNQRWYFENAGNGAYKIVNGNSGLVLDVWGVSTNWGANVVQWGYVGGNNQKWDLLDAGNGTYWIRSVHSGLVLDVQGGSTNWGANVLQWGNNGGNNQKWRIELVSGNCNTNALVSGEEPGEEDAVALNRNRMSVAAEEVNTSAYPNPFTSQLSIRASKAMEKMQVFDLSGRLIYEKNGIGTMNLNLETAHWNAGVYLIKLQLEGADLQTLRVVK